MMDRSQQRRNRVDSEGGRRLIDSEALRISHGLNNALTVALANLDFLSDAKLEAEPASFVTEVLQATQRIHVLAKDLYDSTRATDRDEGDPVPEAAIRSAVVQLERVAPGRVRVDLDSSAIAAFPMAGDDLQSVVVTLGLLMLDILETHELMAIRLFRGEDQAASESVFLEVRGAFTGGMARAECVSMARMRPRLVEAIVGDSGGSLEFVSSSHSPRFVIAIPDSATCG